jgi:hypothetical protein
VPTPDPDRLGGIAWARRTRGALTSRERRRLLGEAVRGQVAYIAGRLQLATGRIAPGAADIAVADFNPPDSAFARSAEEACREQTPGVIGHSHRTWLYGSALAALDRTEVDRELFYVSSLLHDYGIVKPVAGEDFTLRSAERVLRCGKQTGAPAGALDAITVHATPGATIERDGELGFYVQAGAMLDLGGLRAEDVSDAFRADAGRLHPRSGVTAEIASMIRAEARAVPAGRFALLHRCGIVPLIKLAPFEAR